MDISNFGWMENFTRASVTDIAARGTMAAAKGLNFIGYYKSLVYKEKDFPGIANVARAWVNFLKFTQQDRYR
jgi:hypothetical protein